MATEPNKREWPRFARSPDGGSARFDCPGDVPIGWVLNGDTEPLHRAPDTAEPEPPARGDAEARRKPGRPKKAAE